MGRTYAAKQLKKMTNLRFLQADGVDFTGDFQSLLLELRWLQWKGCPSNFVADNFHPKKLVVLDLSYSAISEDWGGWDPLKVRRKEGIEVFFNITFFFLVHLKIDFLN